MANERIIPQINLALCNRCGACLFAGPVHAVEMGPDGPFIARPEDCIYCAGCETFCPTGAISAPSVLAFSAVPFYLFRQPGPVSARAILLTIDAGIGLFLLALGLWIITTKARRHGVSRNTHCGVRP